jgi:hypothetical protein
MKIQTIEDFARPQDLTALRGVMSRLVTRFPENGEILDLIKAEYRPGRPLPAVEKAVAARIETSKALPHTLAKEQRDHLGNSRCLKNQEINLARTVRTCVHALPAMRLKARPGFKPAFAG